MPEPRIYSQEEIQEAGNDLKDKIQDLMREYNKKYDMIIENIVVTDMYSPKVWIVARKVNDPLLVAQKIIPGDEPVIKA